ncbi:hypothetical protein CXB51_002852 [Gossypium anomalum]|uniref:Uncharacterized protein n=1 Tax=Gossypium anomalum TaxID=47600 RepID=A0A8J5Z6H7_9ROSI|nr:hypothetical protein CXB51_002852 [Gossypium anomalum]
MVTLLGKYRETVKAWSGLDGLVFGDEENTRCVANGNKVIGFHCLCPTLGNYSMNKVWLFSSGKGVPIVGKGGKQCWLHKIDTRRKKLGDKDNDISNSKYEVGEMRAILKNEKERTYINIGKETTIDLENLPILESIQHEGNSLLEELELELHIRCK